MYLIIVGVGAITKQLIAIAQDRGHQVAVIEKHAEGARAIMQEFDLNLSLICLMWIGRLEIIPVFLLLSLPLKLFIYRK